MRAFLALVAAVVIAIGAGVACPHLVPLTQGHAFVSGTAQSPQVLFVSAVAKGLPPNRFDVIYHHDLSAGPQILGYGVRLVTTTASGCFLHLFQYSKRGPGDSIGVGGFQLHTEHDCWVALLYLTGRREQFVVMASAATQRAATALANSVKPLS